MKNNKQNRSLRIIKGNILCFLLLFLSGYLYAQKDIYRSIKNFYKVLEKTDQKVPVTFVDKRKFHLDDTQELLQIILVRHGTPKFNKKGWHTFYGARDLLHAYDTVGVYPLNNLPVDLRSENISHIYTSPLERARSTAEQLVNGTAEIRYDSVFIEFRNEIIPLPWIRMPYRVWSAVSRLSWMLGLHSDKVPGLPHERDRARYAAGKLDYMARKENKLLLVAHGILNRYLIRYLKKEGWHHSYDGGYDYVNVQVLSKIVVKK